MMHDVGIVLIGRNEGERLRRALEAARDISQTLVYVDSGSDDGSQDLAQQFGATLVELDNQVQFTAARARNAGFDTLMDLAPDTEFVQLIDGDCALQPGWIPAATKFLNGAPKVGVVCGRRRELFPNASIYNRLIDQEWGTPVGEALACGGDALIRVSAFEQVGGFNEAMIAGEEPEMCQRLRRAGWQIWRLDEEMTLHDADLHRFSQWWQRNRRAGHAYAEGAAMHGHGPDRHNVQPLRSILFWGIALPVAALSTTILIWPWGAFIWLAWPAQVTRLARRDNDWQRAFFMTLGKFAEAQGAMDYWVSRLWGRKLGLIEYK